VSTHPGRGQSAAKPSAAVAALAAVVLAVGIAISVLILMVAGASPAVAKVNDLPTIIANLRTWVMGILAGLATLFLTIGGVRYLMAGGDPSEVERAKAAFRSAGIGYVLAVVAPVVLTVLQSIIGTP
jgi:Type IV secretion system pilin